MEPRTLKSGVVTLHYLLEHGRANRNRRPVSVPVKPASRASDKGQLCLANGAQ